MKSRLILIAALVAAPLVHAADGPLKEKALALAASNKDSVLFLSAVVELEVTVGDNPAKKEERKLEMIGTVIGKDGLIVVPLSTLDVASTIDGRTYNGPQGPTKLSAKGTTKEVKILMPDGSEVEAKVAFKDTDLDLAFIRPEKPDEVKLTAIDTANNAPMGVLDDVIVLGRLGKDLNRQPVVMTNEIIALITKPRTFGKIGTQALGMPVFNKDGKFVGFGINRFSPKGDSDSQGPAPSNVILPAADLLESAAQAK
ncbi:MAG: trypsin-like peptidase domain-containing protein [Luteolibacter sp.]|uniref:trypsin-like peptidase domain-containing protein n=1 Tax=Luteolibacter sp. TaxID=1962973 RepID=UPI003267A754